MSSQKKKNGLINSHLFFFVEATWTSRIPMTYERDYLLKIEEL